MIGYRLFKTPAKLKSSTCLMSKNKIHKNDFEKIYTEICIKCANLLKNGFIIVHSLLHLMQ